MQRVEEFMNKLSGFRRCVPFAAIAACLALNVTNLSAQDNLQSTIGVQFAGLIPSESTGNGISDPLVVGSPITDHATKTGKYSVDYEYQLGKWVGVGAGYGLARYSHHYSGDFGEMSIQSRLREISTDFTLHIPIHINRIHPYAVAGAGLIRFSPASNVNNAAGASAENRYALIYAGGADFEISKRIGVRAEYGGDRYRVPDFQLAQLNMNALTHTNEPSIGVYFKFSNFKRATK
jgi:opacity protein-like surface antigen